MISERSFVRLLVAAIVVASTGLIVRSVTTIFSLFTPIHFWDQWEMAKYVSEGKPISLAYLLSPHNEHIISTSKLLFYIDLWLFDYSNRFLVGAIVLLLLSVACALSLILTRTGSTKEKFLWFSVFGALMLSLAQWENLTIGFQTQFGLTSLFAIFACVCATRFACASEASGLPLAGLALFTPLTVFSMGNGIALICSFVLIAVFGRMRLSRAFPMLLIYVVCIVVFVSQRRGTGTSAPLDITSLTDFLRFFMAVLGGTFTANFGRAAIVGAAFVTIFVFIFVYAACIPWFQRQKIDGATLIFLAVATFALGSAAAVTIGRISLGPGAALTSRYSTPNLLLYCSLLAVYCRFFATRREAGAWQGLFSCVFALIGLGLAVVLALRPDNLDQMTARSEALTSAGYFVLNDVMSDNVLAKLYPAPEAIRLPMEYLRANRLNIFSPEFGLPMLGRSKISSAPDLTSCQTLVVEHASRLDGSSWQVLGRIQGNQTGQAPKWMIATNIFGNIIGYAPPARSAIGGMFEFVVPVHNGDLAFDRKIYLVAQWNDMELCRYERALPLPNRYFSRQQPEKAVEAEYDLGLSLNEQAGKLPAPAQPNDGVFPIVRSTWQGDDTATGSITYMIDNSMGECMETYVGVMRGPTSAGLEVQISEEGGAFETLTLDAISEHQWWWLKISGRDSCGRARRTVVRLVDEGREWGAWAAIMAPVSIHVTAGN
ncbi:hypothetical protein [Rhizobium rhododendri]|uniref:Transmembrane protein n=1 Tax=Rhizobium rhododendri TaxID=2506430 RepID=A0ABY8IPR0_9HYPH|nr:hypothetical protein [Rhizobium rhododendri]WFS25133.1 hypothetical protein PR018_22935 [Rhizobium rhododendri]